MQTSIIRRCIIWIMHIVSKFRAIAIGERSWTLDHVLGDHSSQNDVFCEVSDVILTVLDGRSVSVLAYGNGKTGKTHTIFGSPDDPGLCLRGCVEIIDRSATRSATHRDRFIMTAMEIYNENIRDLLTPATPEKTTPLRVRIHDLTGITHVPGITEVEVTDAVSVANVLATARDAMLHRTSSRANTLFTLTLHSQKLDNPDPGLSSIPLLLLLKQSLSFILLIWPVQDDYQTLPQTQSKKEVTL